MAVLESRGEMKSESKPNDKKTIKLILFSILGIFIIGFIILLSVHLIHKNTPKPSPANKTLTTAELKAEGAKMVAQSSSSTTPPPTPQTTLAKLDSQIKNTSPSNKNELFRLNVDAALLASELNDPSAKIYATNGLKLIPNNNASYDVIKAKLTKISEGQNVPAN